MIAGHDLRSGRAARRWYMLKAPSRDSCRDAYLTPRDRGWWSVAWWRFIAGPAFEAAMGAGLWQVEGHATYTSGRLRLDVWRSFREPWAVNARGMIRLYGLFQ